MTTEGRAQPMTEKDWYSTRELFEKINEVRFDFQVLRTEMQETRESIKKYNGLREQLYNVENEIATMKAADTGKSSVARGIREWGGWVVALAAVLIDIFTR